MLAIAPFIFLTLIASFIGRRDPGCFVAVAPSELVARVGHRRLDEILDGAATAVVGCRAPLYLVLVHWKENFGRDILFTNKHDEQNGNK